MERSDAPNGSGYEFKDAEERAIRQAAMWIAAWAWVAIFVGALTGLGALLGADDPISRIVMASAYIVVGLYFRGAARSMHTVVGTEGEDVPHLVEALESLTSAFQVMVVLIGVAVFAGLLFGLAQRG